MTAETLDFLKNCVIAGMNMVFAGNPGVGKTECARFLSNYIPKDMRVITIEDTPEWHYSKMNPDSDCVEITVGKNLDYTKAIKTCMRLNPKWMILSEARSVEVLSLIEGFSTGVKGMTTLHTDDVRNVPDRILNMAAQKRDEDRLLADIYTFVDIAVLIKRKEVRNEHGLNEVKRYVDQVAFFSREGKDNLIHIIVEDGVFYSDRIPMSLKKIFNDRGIAMGEEGDWSEVSDLLDRNREILQKEVEEFMKNLAGQMSDSEKGGTYRGQREGVG
jgi:pilus assembly protein CpaF